MRTASGGSSVPEPEDLRSRNGALKVDLTIYNYAIDGTTRYCYLDQNGNQSPNLRLKRGDLLILNLKNELTEPANATVSHSTITWRRRVKRAGAPAIP